MGQRAGGGVGTLNEFWIYTVPLFGTYIVDAHWVRHKTICIALAVAITAHVLFIIVALPPVIANARGSLGTFVIGVMSHGTKDWNLENGLNCLSQCSGHLYTCLSSRKTLYKIFNKGQI
jgi:dipeptide/tripeptide permease